MLTFSRGKIHVKFYFGSKFGPMEPKGVPRTRCESKLAVNSVNGVENYELMTTLPNIKSPNKRAVNRKHNFNSAST